MKKIFSLVLSLSLILSYTSLVNAYSFRDAFSDIRGLKDRVVALTSKIENIPLVANPVDPGVACTINSLTASPVSISGTQSVSITWSTGRCASVTLDGTKVLSSTNSAYLTESMMKLQSATKTYTLTASSPGQPVLTKTITVPLSNTTCTIDSFGANPTSLASVGGNTTLTWKTTGCTSVSINGKSYVLTGSVLLSQKGATTYTLTASNLKNTTTKDVVVSVGPICFVSSFTASPATLSAPGNVVLNWASKGCDSVNINGINYPANGSTTKMQLETTRYDLSGVQKNSSGVGFVKADKSITVPVSTPVACSIDSFTASPELVSVGDVSTLRWSTKNCTKIIIDGNTNNDLNGYLVVSPTGTKTYQMVANGADGKAVSKSITITVIPACIINSLLVTPSTIDVGESSTLSWKTTGCTKLLLNGISNSVNGSISVNPSQATAYTIIASNQTGKNITQSTLLTIGSCSFVSASIVGNRLSWATKNCTQILIDGVANNQMSGSILIPSTPGKVYTLIASGVNGTTATKKVASENGTTPCVIESFVVEEFFDQFGNQKHTLIWSTKNCNSIKINDVVVPEAGSESVVVSDSNELIPAKRTVLSNSAVYTLAVTDNAGVAQTSDLLVYLNKLEVKRVSPDIILNAGEKNVLLGTYEFTWGLGHTVPGYISQITLAERLCTSSGSRIYKNIRFMIGTTQLSGYIVGGAFDNCDRYYFIPDKTAETTFTPVNGKPQTKTIHIYADINEEIDQFNGFMNYVSSILFSQAQGGVGGSSHIYVTKINPVSNLDVCPNIAGVQSSIPSGMIKDSSGNCITPPLACTILTFTASPNPTLWKPTVGGTSTLTWTTKDCTSVTINGTAHPANGTLTLNGIQENTVYTLKALQGTLESDMRQLQVTLISG